jgi:transcriptional regulator with XRE-family HTH domain
MDEKVISKNIRRIRLERQLSVDQLAKMSGLTKGYMSKIENSPKAPPFSTLIKIASALNTDVSIFVSADAENAQDTPICVVRANERKEGISRDGTLYGYQYEALAYKKIGKNMEPYIITPAFDEKKVFSHEGEEFMFVLEGMHEFVYGNKKYILEPGDSIYFDSAVPHTGRSIGEKPAKVLVVSYSYKR